MTIVAWTHLLTTVFMAGVIWTIALVHYPSFHFVASERFSSFHHFHSARISMVVVLPMILELFSALFLGWKLRTAPAVAAALLTIGIWLTTFLLVVPNHTLLGERGADGETIRRLVSTNWIRTALWTIKLPLCVYLVRFVGRG